MLDEIATVPHLLGLVEAVNALVLGFGADHHRSMSRSAAHTRAGGASIRMDSVKSSISSSSTCVSGQNATSAETQVGRTTSIPPFRRGDAERTARGISYLAST